MLQDKHFSDWAKHCGILNISVIHGQYINGLNIFANKEICHVNKPYTFLQKQFNYKMIYFQNNIIDVKT